ncbi:UDP-N-acetylmuramyl-tripeptide synthetase [Treponema sp.]|uniref:Mur ligase family protein n=1 Tax=Treponema sp. TaxID=166 RepID=UPI00257AA799|nr:UDP-N-acetylmuramyl-tripeptide synthetase [Treponema sp.]MBE6353790.1 UDP-N-acetylmuramyl-tripeptide synthetase [Treponema sp.]
MKKYLSDLLNTFENTIVAEDGKTELAPGTALKSAQAACISSLAFDSRQVKPGSLFFALPGTHTTGNKFIADAVKNGACAVVFEGEFSEEEKNAIAAATASSKQQTVFLKVESSRFAMSPVSAAFYDYPSKKLVIYGVTGTEGKSSTVAFIWQLLRARGIKAGFISTVQYSLGEDAIDNPQHQTTPEAPIVQRELYEMLENGCTHAVVESSSHGLSTRTNRLGDVLFDVAVFMNVTLEHLEFHGTYEQYKSDKANLFRALDKHDHEKIIAGKKVTVPSFGIVNLEDPAAVYFKKATTKKTFGFTTEGKAGKSAGEEINAQPLPPVPSDIAYLAARNIASARYGLTFTIYRFENTHDLADKNRTVHVKCPLPGAFNAYNIMAALLAVALSTDCTLEDLVPSLESFTPVKGRMTVIDEGQPFEVIVDYAHTPSSFETIFPPVRKRCTGKMTCVFGSGGERDVKKRPLQGEIAGRFCDRVILTDEDPRFEDSMEILNQIASGAKKAGKTEGKDLFLVPDRKAAIRLALKDAGNDDIILLLGKSHENSIIYKDKPVPYDEIAEAKKALQELLSQK